MKLKTLTVQGIRGFNQRQTIEFASDLTLVYGKNGTGKTSLGEALEWLLYGKTAKRERGDSVSKTEYRDTYRNIHYEGSDKPFVEIRVYLVDGSDHTLRRELNSDESSEACLDGAPSADFAALGLASEFDRPMVLQHTLQDFIHLAPKKRYRALSSMLGLESLIILRGHVDVLQGPAGYRKVKPERARKARTFFDELWKAATQHPKTGIFLKHVEGGPESLPQARAALKALVREALDQEVTDQRVSGLLKNARAEKERAVFNWACYATPQLTEDTQTLIDSGLSDEAEQAQNILERLIALPSDQELQKNRQLKDFYKIGLKFRTPEEPERCPFCGARTLTEERLAAIESQAESPMPCEDERAALARELNGFLRGFKPRLPEASDILPELPDKEALAKLESILLSLAGYIVPLPAFKTTFEDVSRQETQLAQARARSIQALDHLQQRIDGTIPEGDTSSEISKRIHVFGAQVKSAANAAHSYSIAYDALTAAVQHAISSQEAVSYISFLIRAWTGWPSVQIAVYDIQLEASLLEFRRQVMDFIKKKQMETLQIKEQDIKEWYSELNPEEPVTFSGIRVATDALRLIAESYGKTMEAAPNLSCSHLNCIGLAVYLACATRKEGPFSYLFIDDPVQSMDEDHIEAFKRDVLQKLFDRKYQVVLLTHLEGFARDIETLYRNLYDLVRFDFTAYSEEGPQIQEVLPPIQSYLREARDKMNAINDANRARSVELLRRFAERFIKDLYVRETRKSISRRFQKARWSELKKLLLECKEFDWSDEGRLQDTYSFTSRHLHEDDSLPQTIPSPHQIKPHIDDMDALLQKYKEILGL